MYKFFHLCLKGLFTFTITLTGGTFDIFDRRCDGQNGLHTHFAHQHNVCFGDGDGVAWSERALRGTWLNIRIFLKW